MMLAVRIPCVAKSVSKDKRVAEVPAFKHQLSASADLPWPGAPRITMIFPRSGSIFKSHGTGTLAVAQSFRSAEPNGFKESTPCYGTTCFPTREPALAAHGYAYGPGDACSVAATLCHAWGCAD